MDTSKNLIWIDLEMSGLDLQKDVILEIAVIVTDEQLNIIAEGPVIAIHQDDTVLDSMDEWNTVTHGETGLTERVRNSNISIEEAELIVLDFLKSYCTPKRCPLCGNSVHIDRSYIQKYMSKLYEFVHYRIIDVSTIKRLAKSWRPDLPEMSKKENHAAMDDIRESIEELAYYKKTLFKV